MSWWMIGIASLLSGLLGSLGMGAGAVLLLYLRTIAGVEQLTAQGINLLFFLPIATLAVLMHCKNKLIEWKSVGIWTAVGVPGALLGVWLSGILPMSWLPRLLGLLLLIIGLRELCAKEKTK